MSARTASIASIWSGVSRYGKRASNSVSHSPSPANAWPGAAAALGVEVDQLAGERLRGAAGTELHLLPLLAAELRQRRVAGVGAHVARDLVQLVARHEHAVAVLELELEVVAGDPADRLGLEAHELRDAVVLVDDRAAGAQLGERGDHGTAGMRAG